MFAKQTNYSKKNIKKRIFLSMGIQIDLADKFSKLGKAKTT